MNKKVNKKLRCIVCPEGCTLNISYNKSDLTINLIEGFSCKRGVKFANQEIKNPLRTMTTTIAIESEYKNRLSVRSSNAAPKDKIKEMVFAAKKIRIKPPVKMGDILVRNFLNTGVDLISSETLKK